MARRLPDRTGPALKALLVGINPSLRSAALGHHFAGRSNRFWDLLRDSGLTPRRLSSKEDRLLPGFGLGLTNIASRPTRSSSQLQRRDFEVGRRVLAEKIARRKPACVAFVGITAYREYFGEPGSRPRKVRCGLQNESIQGAALFVLPNPSGRNAHYSYRQMLRHFRAFARWLKVARTASSPARSQAHPASGRRRGSGLAAGGGRSRERASRAWRWRRSGRSRRHR